MRKFFLLLGREIKSYFYSPVAYAVMCFFELLMGFTFWLGLNFINGMTYETTVVESFFNTVPFWFFILIFPLLTMRVFAEEFKLGTVESLMTAPVTDAQVVLAKFFGALVFYILLWLPTPFFFYVYKHVTHQPLLAPPGAFAGAYLLVLLIGMFYISIGCLASVGTRDQIVAAVISFVATVMTFFFGVMGFVLRHTTPALHDFFSYFSSIEHMADFSKGMLDSRPIVYYLSMTALMLVLTYQVFQSRKWKV